jgi:hypothetical protein
MLLKNKELREIKLSKLTNIVYVRSYHFNTLCYSLVALLL